MEKYTTAELELLKKYKDDSYGLLTNSNFQFFNKLVKNNHPAVTSIIFSSFKSPEACDLLKALEKSHTVKSLDFSDFRLLQSERTSKKIVDCMVNLFRKNKSFESIILYSSLSSGLNVIFDALVNSTQLHELLFGDLNDTDWASFTRLLNSTGLTTLNLNNRGLDNTKINLLATALRTNTKVKTLLAGNYDITNIDYLAACLKDNTTLTTLDLHASRITHLPDELFQNQSITVLRLGMITIDDVVPSLESNTTLTELSLTKSTIINPGFLGNVERNNSLKILDLSLSQIRTNLFEAAVFGEELVYMIKNNQTLYELNLNNSEILLLQNSTDFFKALETSQIQKLHLQWSPQHMMSVNKHLYEQFDPIGQALPFLTESFNNNNLRELDLSNNRSVTEEGLINLFSILPDNDKLESIKFTSHAERPPSDKLKLEILKTLRYNSALETIRYDLVHIFGRGSGPPGTFYDNYNNMITSRLNVNKNNKNISRKTLIQILTEYKPPSPTNYSPETLKLMERRRLMELNRKKK